MTKPVIDDAMIDRAIDAGFARYHAPERKYDISVRAKYRQALEAALNPPRDRRWADKPQADRRTPAEPLPTPHEGRSQSPEPTPTPEVTVDMTRAGEMAYIQRNQEMGTGPHIPYRPALAAAFRAMYRLMPRRRKDDPRDG